MKQLLFLAGIVGVFSSSTAAHAQSIEASRYVNRDGIEVIQARPHAQSDAGSSVTEIGAAPGQPRALKPASASRMQAAQAVSDPRLQVSARDQSARDKDRLAILNQELHKEVAEYETKTKVLQTPSMRNKLPEAELARLRELASDHEKNIRALMAEISGVRR